MRIPGSEREKPITSIGDLEKLERRAYLIPMALVTIAVKTMEIHSAYKDVEEAFPRTSGESEGSEVEVQKLVPGTVPLEEIG